MPADVETMAYIKREDRDIPWHRLGTAVPEGAASADEILHAADLDWEVVQEPIYAKLGDDWVQLPKHQALVRTSDDRIFGVAGNGYSVVQNREVFESVSEWLADGRLQFETAGALHGGARIWGLARIGEDFLIGGKDPITPYVLVTNGHDGNTSVVIKPTPVRVVCANTMAAALQGNQREYRIRHTANAKDRIRQASATLGLVSKREHEVMQKLEELAQMPATQEHLEKVVDLVHPRVADASDRIEKRIDADRDKLLRVYNTSPTVDKGSRYGLYNAVTEYIDHEQVRKGMNPGSSNRDWLERRALFTVDGDGADQRDRVFKYLATA